MANKFLDDNGLLYLWQKITNKFVAKETGKGLSTNDYSTEEKTKLAGIDTGANKTTVVDNLTSDSATDALSAKQGKELDKRISAITGNMENLGAGDMLKGVYDTDGNGKVDNADNADKLGGELPSAYVKQDEIKVVAKTGSYNDLTDKPTNFAPSSHTHEIGEINELVNTLTTKAEKEHQHSTSDITDFNTEMEKKANTTHTHEIGDINGVEEIVSEIAEIANGKCKTEVFDTEEDMNNWIANSENTKNLKVGDVFLIRAVNVPDYWWDGTSAQILETTKVEVNVISNTEIDTIVATS